MIYNTVIYNTVSVRSSEKSLAKLAVPYVHCQDRGRYCTEAWQHAACAMLQPHHSMAAASADSAPHKIWLGIHAVGAYSPVRIQYSLSRVVAHAWRGREPEEPSRGYGQLAQVQLLRQAQADVRGHPARGQVQLAQAARQVQQLAQQVALEAEGLQRGQRIHLHAPG